MDVLRGQKGDGNKAIYQKAAHQQQGCNLCPMRQAYHEYEGLYYRPYKANLQRRFDYDRELPTRSSKVQPRKRQQRD